MSQHVLYMNVTVTPSVGKLEGSGRNTRMWPLLAIAAAVTLLGARFFLVISRYSINVFFYDQWQYLTPFFRHQPGIVELFFLQNGPHREGIGLIADKFLYPLTDWNARVDAFVVGGTIFAAMLLALRLKYKLFGALSYSDVSIPLLFLTLQQSEILVGTPNPAYSGFPLLLMMCYCLALLGRNYRLRYLLLLALNFFLIYTGFGVFMGVVTVLVFLIECYWSHRRMTSVPLGQAIAGLGTSVACLGSFFLRYTFWPAADCFEFPHRHLLQYPHFAALTFAAFIVPRPLRVSWGMTVLGAAILLGVLAVLCWYLFRLWKDAGRHAELVGAVLLTYSLLFSANAAVGRLCLGLGMAFSSRYVTLMVPAFLAIYFFLLSSSWYGKRNFILALWILMLLPAALRKPWEVRWYFNGKRDWTNCYVRTGNIRFCDKAANFAIYFPPEPAGLELQEKLDYLKQHHLNLFHEGAGPSLPPPQ